MLRDAAEDIAHEMFLFGVACRQVEQRIAYQAWYMFARNLMDFFDTWPDDRANDAILACDYFDPPGDWHTRREAIPRPANYADYRVAAHKRAAHLTYSRAVMRKAGAAPSDPSQAVTDYLMSLCSLFLQSLAVERQAWFRQTPFPLPWKAA
jgi:hypothetical protein